MSALPEALPLALAAAVYPPALVVLLLFMSAPRPRPLVVAYFAGAATVTIGSGLIALALVDGADLTSRDSSGAGGVVDIVLGLVLLLASVWARRRAARPRVPDGGSESTGRIAAWSQLALRSRKWAVVLGLLMFLPSPLYLLAVKEIADSGDPAASSVPAVLICAAGVLLFVEVPLVAMLVRPAGVAAALGHVHGWLTRNGWNLAAGLCLIAGVYGVVKGIGELRG